MVRASALRAGLLKALWVWPLQQDNDSWWKNCKVLWAYSKGKALYKSDDYYYNIVFSALSSQKLNVTNMKTISTYSELFQFKDICDFDETISKTDSKLYLIKDRTLLIPGFKIIRRLVTTRKSIIKTMITLFSLRSPLVKD